MKVFQFKKLFILAGVLCLCIGLMAQSKTQLQDKKNKLLKDIKYTNSLIKQNQNNQQLSLKQIQKISANIELRAELLKTYEEEIQLLNKDITDHQMQILELEGKLKSLKKGYQKMVYQSWKNRNTLSKWMYIFSAKSFNQGLRRLRYYKHIKELRALQAKSIEKSKSDLGQQVELLKSSRAEKEKTKKEKNEELKLLEKEKDQKNKVLESLKSKEKELLAKVKKQEKEKDNLTKKINAIVDAIKKETKTTKTTTKTGDNKTINKTSGNSNSSGFSSNKGKMSWPVEKGTITGKFGIQNHPVLKNVEIKNDGIDISTDKGANVRAIYKGTVSGVFKVDGYENVVIIRHGEYLTVYSHLANVIVNKGDEVGTEQKIGTVATNDEGESYINFQVRYGSSVQNPSSWLVK